MIVTSTVSPSLKTGLQFLGAWPDMPHSSVYSLIYVPSMLIIQYFQYVYIFTHMKLTELPNFVDGLYVTLDYTLTIFKLIVLWIHRGLIHQMLVAMNNDWRTNIDQHLFLMTIKANISHLCSKAMLNFNIFIAVVYLLVDYAIGFIYVMDEYNDTQRLPIKMQFPFEIDQSPMFGLITVIIFVHSILNTYIVTILNVLIFTLVFHTSGQIEIMCQEFRTISEKSFLYISSTFALRRLISRHNKIISFSDHIDKLFSSMALIQILCDTVIICCLGSLIMTAIHNKTSVVSLVKSICAYNAVILEIFIFCFAGEYLTFTSKSIANAAYESTWYAMPFSQSKIMQLIIMRSQKQMMITAGSVMDLSLETFATIIKASVSYISILYAMY